MNQGFNLSERNLPPENTALSDLSLSHQDMIFVNLPPRVSALPLRLLSPFCAIVLGASWMLDCAQDSM